jgi:carbon monoxide dehydrogenase subunit G
MRLSFTGAPAVAAPRARVWECLMDPEFVAASAPGVEKVEQLDPTHYKVISGFGVGAVKLRFTLDVEIADLVAPERATMRARGKAPGSNVDVTASIRLEEPSPGRTVMHWTSDSDVSGTVASVGGRLLEGTARKLTEQFWQDFARRVSET